MSFSLSIFTEASSQIGTGHLIESFNIARMALNEGVKVSLWVTESSPISLLSKSPCSYHTFDSLTSEESKKIRSILIRDGCRVMLFNFRCVSNENILSLRFDNLKTVCIDELGGRRLDCNVIINPLIVDKYHNYSSNNDYLKIYTGPNYLSISPEFTKIHHEERIFNEEIQTVSVCMGGVDRTGTTLKLINALAEWNPDIRKNIIIGGGFLYLDEVHKKVESLKDKGFGIYHNVPSIESFFLEADIAFTAGGNTLYELACVGTPSIVLYEDEHEKENGIAFERLGFGYCIGRGSDVSEIDILNAVEKFRTAKVRYAHSSRGKEIVDGMGCQRILNIIKSLLYKAH